MKVETCGNLDCSGMLSLKPVKLERAFLRKIVDKGGIYNKDERPGSPPALAS
jgi:hypothetical protein